MFVDILLIISLVILSYPSIIFLRKLGIYIYNRYIWKGDIVVRKIVDGVLVDYYTLKSDGSIITHGINNDSSKECSVKSERNE